jgi:hypothetical protein
VMTLYHQLIQSLQCVLIHGVYMSLICVTIPYLTRARGPIAATAHEVERNLTKSLTQVRVW